LWKPSAPNGANGSLTDFGSNNGVSGINGPGQVVGASSMGPANHAFLWTPSTPNGTSGGMIDLGTLGSGDSLAYAINTAGQVVGTSLTSSGLKHAFLWTPTTPNGKTGTMIDLNTLTGSSTVSLQAATGINDQGQIVGYGVLQSNGSTHAFLLSPTSTATALAQLAITMPLETTGGSTSVPGSDTSVVSTLVGPLPNISGFAPAVASVSLSMSQPTAAPAAATISAVPFAEGPPFGSPFTNTLTTFLTPQQTAFADGAVGDFTGSLGSDWYIVDAADAINGANNNDSVTRIGL
jgi:probable HAF family extracellular repeat protein